MTDNGRASSSRKSAKFIVSGGDVESDEEVEEEELPMHEGVRLIYNMMHNSDIYESPIDIFLPKAAKIELPTLEWHHMDLPPKKVKVTNTGHTVILSGKWHQERPYLSGGPFVGNYVFSQLHFHWGENNMEGSEHTIENCQLPLEMHVVFFKSCYLTQESALKKKDGMCVIAFLFKLQEESNPALNAITEAIYNIREAQNSTRLKSYPLDTYMTPFLNDYFLYSGSVNTNTCIHHILWLISRVPMGVSVAQMEMFRLLWDLNGQKLLRNFRTIQPANKRIIYHANPSGHTHSTLVILQKEWNYKLSHRPQQVNKYPRSSKEYISSTGTTIYRAEVIHNPSLYRKYAGRKPKRVDFERSQRSRLKKYCEDDADGSQCSRSNKLCKDESDGSQRSHFNKYCKDEADGSQCSHLNKYCEDEADGSQCSHLKKYCEDGSQCPRLNKYCEDEAAMIGFSREESNPLLEYFSESDEENKLELYQKYLQVKRISEDDQMDAVYQRCFELESIAEEYKKHLNPIYYEIKHEKSSKFAYTGEEESKRCVYSDMESTSNETTCKCPHIYEDNIKLHSNIDYQHYSSELDEDNLCLAYSGNTEFRELCSYRKFPSMDDVQKTSTKVNIDPKILERMKLVDKG